MAYRNFWYQVTILSPIISFPLGSRKKRKKWGSRSPAQDRCKEMNTGYILGTSYDIPTGQILGKFSSNTRKKIY